MKVSVIGGGTGSSAVINGLKSYPDIDIDVIVGMADDGGSNAVLRDEFGLLPLSDIRKSIIALSTLENSDILRSLFTYRFSEGTGLTGHTLGNLIMTALSRISNSERKAVQEMCDIFQVRGRVLPITYENYVISAEYDNGMIIHGEHLIDEPSIPERTHIKRFWAEPKVSADAEALGSLENADMIIIGPGDIYTTILATMIPENVYQILRNAQGKIVGFVNIIPCATPGMANFDLMRRTADAPNGVMDFLFVKMFETLRAAGYATCNLGMVPMSGIAIPGNFQERIIKLAYERIRQFSHYKSLRYFKEKFDPQWEMMYLVYNEPYDLIYLPAALEKVMESVS